MKTITKDDIKAQGCSKYTVDQLVKSIEYYVRQRVRVYPASKVKESVIKRLDNRRIKLDTRRALENLLSYLSLDQATDKLIDELARANTGNATVDLELRNLAGTAREYNQTSQQLASTLEEAQKLAKDALKKHGQQGTGRAREKAK